MRESMISKKGTQSELGTVRVGKEKKISLCYFSSIQVESCQVLKTVAGYITDKDYNVYLKQGEDTYTGQNVGMLTLIDPVTDLQRTEDRQSYPLSSSKCGYSGSSSDTGVSKHYYTTFEIGDATITWIGVHFLSNPTSEEKCAKREAQALIIQGLIKDALALDYEVVVLGVRVAFFPVSISYVHASLILFWSPFPPCFYIVVD